jgi:DNA-binding transcriptional ArsR family regulator
MPDPHAQKQVPLLAALAQSTRLLILDRVAEAGPDGLAAGDIARALRCPASTLSFHLKELSRNGVLEAHPSGRFIRYSLRRGALQGLAGYLSKLAGGTPPGRPRKGSPTPALRRGRAGEAGQLTIFGD